jgi:hypothetical protein
MTPMFSINAASELLERDRRTIGKALRHVPPDKKEKGGQPRWKLPTILSALDQLPGSSGAPRRHTTGHGTTSDAQFMDETFNILETFVRASDAIVALEEMPFAKRKAEAKRVFAKMEAHRLACEAGHPDGLPDELSGVLAEMFRAVLFACHMVICEDDGKTPLKAYYGDHKPPVFNDED